VPLGVVYTIAVVVVVVAAADIGSRSQRRHALVVISNKVGRSIDGNLVGAGFSRQHLVRGDQDDPTSSRNDVVVGSTTITTTTATTQSSIRSSSIGVVIRWCEKLLLFLESTRQNTIVVGDVGAAVGGGRG